MQKIMAVIFISVGLAVVSVPFFYHFYGSYKINEMTERFEENVRQEQMEDGEKEEEREAPGGSEDEALLSSGEVIGLIEIEALRLKYPIVEGAEGKQLACGIGHTRYGSDRREGELRACRAQGEQVWNLF